MVVVVMLQQLLQQALLAASQAGNTNAKLLACLSQPVTTTSHQTSAPAALISSVNHAAVSRQDIVSSTTEATTAVSGGNRMMPVVPNSANLPVALAAASLASNGTVSSFTHITPNINQLLPSKFSISVMEDIFLKFAHWQQGISVESCFLQYLQGTLCIEKFVSNLINVCG